MLGRELVRAAEGAGHTVRIASRRDRGEGDPPRGEWARVDAATGEGVQAAVAGVDAVIHAASDPRRAEAVDVGGTRTLMDAARAAGVSHLVYVSIVGVDRIPYSYYRRKLEAEEIVAGSGVPWSILRATQFHPFLEMLLRAAARVPLVIPLPTDFRFQSVDPAEVANRLVRSIAEGPGGRLRDFGGPQVLTLGEAAGNWRAERGIRKRVVPLPLPGRTAAAFRMGLNTAPDGEPGQVGWREWLRAHGAVPRTPAPGGAVQSSG